METLSYGMAKLPQGKVFTAEEVSRALKLTNEATEPTERKKRQRIIDMTLYRFRTYAKLVAGEDFVRLNERIILYTETGLAKLKKEWKSREYLRDRSRPK